MRRIYETHWYINRDTHGQELHALCSTCNQTIIYKPARFSTREQRNEFLRENNRGQSPPNKGVRMQYDRKCYACGSKTTLVDKTGRRHWRLNHDEHDNVLCHKCKMRYIVNPNRRVQVWQYWKGKEIPVKYNPRTGFCSKCGKTGQTQLHHTSYKSDNPLDNTVELCISCHSKETHRLAKLKVKL